MNKRENLRINVYFMFVLVAAFLVSYNLFILTYIRHQSYLRTAEAQSQNVSDVLARGNILFKNGGPVNGVDNQEYLAATNKKFPFAYIVPSDIDLQTSEDVINKVN